MIRREHEPRPDWQARVRESGFDVEKPEEFWKEGVYYEVPAAMADEIATATRDCYDLFERAAEAMLGYHDGEWLTRLGIPAKAHAAIRETWESTPPCLNFGRMDFAIGADGVPKLMEFNCDAPVTLVEAAVLQAAWAQDLFPDREQFNMIEQRFKERWAEIAHFFRMMAVNFACVPSDSGEDQITCGFHAYCAEQSGITINPVLLNEIGLSADGKLVTPAGQIMTAIFKLYHWEHLISEGYATEILADMKRAVWIEPIWKMLWTNKGVMSLMKSLDPSCPYLPETSFGPIGSTYVKKPLWGAGGRGVEIVRNGQTIAKQAGRGVHTAEINAVYQEFIDIPETAPGIRPIVGSWIVDGIPCGIGIREGGLITNFDDLFVPHIIL